MSNLSISTKALLYIAEPIITNIIADIIKSTITAEKLMAIKEKIYASLVELTGRTSFTVDDALVKAIFGSMNKQDGSFAKVGDMVLDAIEQWVAASETKWDDKALTPVLVALREAAGIPDGEE